MKRYVFRDPFETAAGISQKINMSNNKEVSCFTVLFKEFGKKTCSPATNPITNKKDKVPYRRASVKARVIQKHRNWSQVHFINEVLFNLVEIDYDDRQYVRCFTGDKLKSKCVKNQLNSEDVAFWRGECFLMKEWDRYTINLNLTVNANIYLHLAMQHVIHHYEQF